MAGRSSFGQTKKTASGRYRAFYERDRVVHTAGHTFPNKRQADAWLRQEWERISNGAWTAPRSAQMTLREFVEQEWWPVMGQVGISQAWRPFTTASNASDMGCSVGHESRSVAAAHASSDERGHRNWRCQQVTIADEHVKDLADNVRSGYRPPIARVIGDFLAVAHDEVVAGRNVSSLDVQVALGARLLAWPSDDADEVRQPRCGERPAVDIDRVGPRADRLTGHSNHPLDKFAVLEHWVCRNATEYDDFTAVNVGPRAPRVHDEDAVSSMEGRRHRP